MEAKQESTPDEAQQQCYLVEFNRQYKEQLAKMQAEALAKVQKTEVKQEQTVETAAQPGELCCSSFAVQALSFTHDWMSRKHSDGTHMSHSGGSLRTLFCSPNCLTEVSMQNQKVKLVLVLQVEQETTWNGRMRTMRNGKMHDDNVTTHNCPEAKEDKDCNGKSSR